MKKSLLLSFLATLLTGCVTSPPKHTENICHIFEEKSGWYKEAKQASKRWGTPIPTLMAMMHQESRFVAKAKPPRTKILWIFPGPRKSSAYGYPQAKDETWDWYKKNRGNWGADRDDFDDAIDFMAWYNQQSVRRNRITLGDSYNLYLAYHEGHGGYSRGTYKKKSWLKKVARKVSNRSQMYNRQLQKCQKRLESTWWWPF